MPFEPIVSEGAVEIFRDQVEYPLNHYFVQFFMTEVSTQEKWDELGFMYLLALADIPIEKQLYLWAIGMVDEVLGDRMFVYTQENVGEFKKSASGIKRLFEERAEEAEE